MIIFIYKAKYIFFLSYSTLISLFITNIMFFFVESYNLLVLSSFKKLVLITVYYLSLFKITKSELKKIYVFFYLKIKPLI